MNVVLSIKPKWAERIYTGKKTVEWRKSLPQRYGQDDVVFLYETAPVRRITGIMHVSGFLQVDMHPDGDGMPAGLSTDEGRDALERGCVPMDELRAYAGPCRCLYAWKIERSERITQDLVDFHFLSVPQSWGYVDALLCKEKQW